MSRGDGGYLALQLLSSRQAVKVHGQDKGITNRFKTEYICRDCIVKFKKQLLQPESIVPPLPSPPATKEPV